MSQLVTHPGRMASMMIGFPEARVLGVNEDAADVHVSVETAEDASRCAFCGSQARSEGRPVMVRRPDGLMFGRPLEPVWQLRRWSCPTPRACGRDLDRERPRSTWDDAGKP
jgi:hypothetical protein